MTLDMTQEHARKIERERDDYKQANWRLRRFLEELFDKLIGFVIFLWVVTYIGAVLWFWQAREDKATAVTIIVSLTIAHGAIGFHNYLKRKRKELTEK